MKNSKYQVICTVGNPNQHPQKCWCPHCCKKTIRYLPHGHKIKSYFTV